MDEQQYQKRFYYLVINPKDPQKIIMSSHIMANDIEDVKKRIDISVLIKFQENKTIDKEVIKKEFNETYHILITSDYVELTLTYDYTIQWT